MGFELQPTVWITLEDGTRLAAAIWMPDGDGPYPAVLEYLPYRRGDTTAARDDATYPAFAEAGIVGVRVDARGTGDSDGLFDDEYSPRELADACEVIAWIAAQPWSNGAAGMMGISWGGFNALQVAAMRPPALKAVISIASTADRYSDDIHYKGGCLLSANVSWAGTMMNYCSRPPDPDVVGNGWAELWRERLDAQPMLLETWLRHQRRDAYWRHGSICEDWAAITCPVWVIAGWGDGYRNCPATLAANLAAPVKAMTGPWVHKYPHFAMPEPRADFLGLAIDWWRTWLAGEDRGVDAWPDYRAYLLEAVRPSPWRARDPGRWIGTGWPGSDERRTYSLGADRVLGSEVEGRVEIATRQHCGVMGGEFFALAPNGDLPADQRLDDALSVCWETGPLWAPLGILGRPVLSLPITIDRAQGNLAARLVDVHPDGRTALVARGLMNLCHRGGSADPVAMVPGEMVEISLAMDETAYQVLPGHRLRLALSTAYWPMVLPSPAPVTAVIEAGAGALLDLPLAGDAAATEVPEPAEDTLPVYPKLADGHMRRQIERDLNTGRVRYVISEDTGLTEVPRNGMQARETRDEIWEIDPGDPLSATANLVLTAERQRGAWQTRTRSEIRFSCTAETWDVEAELAAWRGEAEFCRRTWAFSVPRDHV